MNISSENLRKLLHPIQIDTTHFCFKPRRNPGFQSQGRSANRAAVRVIINEIMLYMRDGPRARARARAETEPDLLHGQEKASR